ncbi:MAG: hypothetical protein P4L90_15375, partial [Rhodopila sp.]|nr:hypothetical protein [Rhodopila sp.]
MLLVEADGKALFAAYGIPVPPGRVLTAGERAERLPGTGPWMVKAQIPVGGRGKAGGIRRCDTQEAVTSATAAMLGTRLKGLAVDAVLVEQAARGEERYLALMLDPRSYGVRAIYLAAGGMEVERAGTVGGRIC